MDDQRRTRIIAVVIAGSVLAVVWNAFSKVHVSSRRPAPSAPVAAVETVAPPAPTTTTQGNTAENAGPSYMDQLARAEIRRRIRASESITYLNEVVAATPDSVLHRWDNRVSNPVRVWLTPSTVANFQPVFLDAIRAAFQRWEEVVPVRFNLNADSANAEVHFAWKIQFDIDRTGQTDLEWDPDGHLLNGVITIATFDPKGLPLHPDDVRVVALHEIGHLVGLDHSPDSTDLMYAKGIVRDLSSRDIQTARLLYELAPGSIR
jgi:hypothetical protein